MADGSAPISPALAEARARAEAARARRAASALSEEAAELHKLALQEAEDLAAARADEKKARELRGLVLEGEARKKSGGKYQVKAIDIAKLLPDIDPATLPGDGVIVVRSPLPGSWATFLREQEHKARDLPDICADLVCESTVFPDVSASGAGERYRVFWESALGCGTVVTVADDVAALGGAAAKQAKRGRG